MNRTPVRAIAVRSIAVLASISLLLVAPGCEVEAEPSGPPSYSGDLPIQGNTGLGVTADEVTVDSGSTAGTSDGPGGNAGGGGDQGGGLDIPGMGGGDGAAEDDGHDDEPSAGGIPGNTGGGSSVPGGDEGGGSPPGEGGSGSSGGSSGGGGIDIPGTGGGDSGGGGGPDGGGSTGTDGCDQRCSLCQEYTEIMLDCAFEAGVPEQLIADFLAQTDCADLSSEDPTADEFDCLIEYVYYEVSCDSMESIAAAFDNDVCEFEDGPDPVECGSGQIVNCWGECTWADYLGDGSCDEDFDCGSYDYDYGDCGDVVVDPAECGDGQITDCWGGCTWGESLGDGYCDESFYCEEYGYDYGDCEDEPTDPVDCGSGEVANCWGGCSSWDLLENGECDEDFACEEWDFDYGECKGDVEPGECGSGEVVNCDGGCTSADWVGDDICDEMLLCEEFDFDGGDCEDSGGDGGDGGTDTPGGGGMDGCDEQCSACLDYMYELSACLEEAEFPPIDGFDPEQCYSQSEEDPGADMYWCMTDHVQSLQCTDQQAVLEALQSNPCAE